MNLEGFILLQAQGGQGDITQTIIFFGGFLLIAYFFFIRPKQKQQRLQNDFSKSLAKGDLVVTIGGLHGKVSSVDDNTVILEVDKGSKLKFEKSSISLESSKQYEKK